MQGDCRLHLRWNMLGVSRLPQGDIRPHRKRPLLAEYGLQFLGQSGRRILGSEKQADGDRGKAAG